MNTGELANKRRFILRVLFPFGPIACKELGIVPVSEDVGDKENAQANAELYGAASAWGEFLMKRVTWYMEAYHVLHSEHPAIEGTSTERSLEEHLASFGASIMHEEREM